MGAGREGWPLAWRLKSVDTRAHTHTHGKWTPSSCAWRPLHGHGGRQGETWKCRPAETTQSGAPRTGDGRGEAGCWLRSREVPSSHRGPLVRHVEAVDRASAGVWWSLRVQEGQEASPAPCPSAHWGAPKPHEAGEGAGRPWRTVSHPGQVQEAQSSGASEALRDGPEPPAEPQPEARTRDAGFPTWGSCHHIARPRPGGSVCTERSRSPLSSCPPP